eukprot:COSAG05_NODE_4175_length_1638_cov_3.174439_1_plen_119_part_10
MQRARILIRMSKPQVLQGHIALDTAVWPEHTPGFILDTFARAPLWQLGLSYGHGTGHGVGAALHVHEGPASISPRHANVSQLFPCRAERADTDVAQTHMSYLRVRLKIIRNARIKNCR